MIMDFQYLLQYIVSNYLKECKYLKYWFYISSYLSQDRLFLICSWIINTLSTIILSRSQDSSISFVIQDPFDQMMKVEVSIAFILFDLMCGFVDAIFEYYILQQCHLMWLQWFIINTINFIYSKTQDSENIKDTFLLLIEGLCYDLDTRC